MPRRIDPGNLASVLPPGGLTLVSSCSAESTLLADAVEEAGDALGPMTFSGVFVPGLNRRTWRAGSSSRVLTFFMTPELRSEAGHVEFLPLCYQDILVELRRRSPAAALFMCSPPDADGRCSFGTEVSFIADLWRQAPVRVAHVNPLMPRTCGDPGIDFEEITAFVECEQPLLGTPAAEFNAEAERIAAFVAPFIRDRYTLQTGLGSTPDAILSKLVDRRGLRLHTGLVGDGALALRDSGALAGATVGTAIGSEALYDAVSDPLFQFRPVSITHGADVLAGIDRLITINSAISVDLFGQTYAEAGPRGLMSGPGGASDFARGARARGLRIVALPASAKGKSRIVPPNAGAGPVSLGRMDTDVIATEHGAADLRGLAHHARAEALIAIGSPEHRSELSTVWADYANKL